jgi:uncharacterized protein YwgA
MSGATGTAFDAIGRCENVADALKRFAGDVERSGVVQRSATEAISAAIAHTRQDAEEMKLAVEDLNRTFSAASEQVTNIGEQSGVLDRSARDLRETIDGFLARIAA